MIKTLRFVLTITPLLSVVGSFASPSVLLAQSGTVQAGETLCPDQGKRLDECLTELLSIRAEQPAEAETTLAYQDLTALFAPGLDPQDASTFTNFLPGFLSRLGFSGVDGDGLRIGFDNPLFSGRSGSFAYSIGAELAEPELFDQLLNLLPEEGRADQKSALEDDLSDFDTTDLRLRISLEENTGHYRWGRNPRDYSDYLSMAFEAAAAKEASENQKTHLRTLSRLLSNSTSPEADEKLLAIPISRMDPGQRAAAKAVVKQALEAAAENKNRVEAINAEVNKVAKLISNQPQLVLDITRKERDELTGVSQWLYELKFEKGFGNINKFARWARQQDNCKREVVIESLGAIYQSKPLARSAGHTLQPRLAYECLERFSKENEKKGKNANRTAVSISYVQSDAYSFADEDGKLALDLPAGNKWVGSLAYGRDFSGALGQDVVVNTLRLDVKAAYEDPAADEEMRQSRFLATATITQRLTDTLSVAVSAVYANRSEFLGDVDEEITANLGLRWTVDRKESK